MTAAQGLAGQGPGLESLRVRGVAGSALRRGVVLSTCSRPDAVRRRAARGRDRPCPERLARV